MKNKFNLTEAINRQVVIRERIQAIATQCETENRERTDAENSEYRELMREAQTIQMRINANSMATAPVDADAYREASRTVREALRNRQSAEIVLREDGDTPASYNVTSSGVATGGLVSLNIHDIVKPLENGLILSKIGIPFQTGLTGDHVWPVVDAIEATVNGEAVALSDTELPLSKLKPVPERIGCAVPVTYQAITASDGAIERIVKEQLPMAISRTLNKIAFSPFPVNNATNLKSPFCNEDIETIEFDGSVPTFKELVKMKGIVLGSGIENDGTLAYVMTEEMKAELESTPRDEGSGLMICMNDKINGVPVLCTGSIGEGNIGIGVWSYFPMGLFGNIRLQFDAQPRKDIVDCVINADAGCTVLRPEAFALGSAVGEFE